MTENGLRVRVLVLSHGRRSPSDTTRCAAPALEAVGAGHVRDRGSPDEEAHALLWEVLAADGR